MNNSTRPDPDHSSENKTSFSLNERVRIEMVENVYAQTKIGLFASAFCASILLWALYVPDKSGLLTAWYLFFMAVLVVRFSTIDYFMKVVHSANLTFWRNLFIFGSSLSGMCWGFVASVLLPYNDIMQLTLTVLILSGMTAGSVSSLCGILSAAILYLTLCLLPLIIRLVILANPTYLLFDACTCIYLLYLISLAIKAHRAIKHSITLQFENNELLTHLSVAKHELEAINTKLEYAASHDVLTGLANRIAFENYCSAAIKKANLEQKLVSIFYINIDNFKEVNDTYGYRLGSLLLKKFAERIQYELPPQSLASRLNNDEIVIASESLLSRQAALDYGDKIKHSIALSCEINNSVVSVTASIGISFYPIDGRDFESIIRSAEKMMQQAKKDGGNRISMSSGQDDNIQPTMNDLFK